ncbi:MAG TPA: uroporphyrinogen decarboxylase family protein [Armatimonadota bacterium]|jgi:hypothetical protein
MPQPDRLQGFPFEEHNAEVRAAWAALDAGRPTRTPSVLGANTRFMLMNLAASPDGPDWRRYMESPDFMFESQLRFQRWMRFNMLQDAPLGLPDAWRISPDFQNTYEAAWLGCPIHYPEGQVPCTTAGFEDCPERVMEGGIPDPFGGTLALGLEYYERYMELARGREYLGRPIEPQMPGWGWGSDGVMTVACNLFGPNFVCMAMAAEPERLHALFEFLTEATIHRLHSWRRRYGISLQLDNWCYADDSVALIGVAMYREHVLPYHKRVYDAVATPKGRGIHLCGNATRHFKTMCEELGIVMFDTGFPVDFAWVREQVGPNVRIQGGPHVDVLRYETPAAVRIETERILDSGILEGGQFVLREGNNLAPETPIANTEAMYGACRRRALGAGQDPAGVLKWLDEHPL